MHNSNVQLKNRARLQSQLGFSLTDALVGTALGLISMATILGFYRFQTYGLSGHSAQLDVQGTARTIVQLMVSEIRRAGGDPLCAKTFEGIAEAKSDRLRILSDLNGSGAIDAPGEDVTYSLNASSGVLTRSLGSTSDALSDSTVRVTSLQFRYFNAAGAELSPGSSGLTSTQRSQVQRIRVTITVQRTNVDPRNTQPLTATVSSGTDLRNRFFVNRVGCV
jgi:hypothetical protein